MTTTLKENSKIRPLHDDAHDQSGYLSTNANAAN